MDKCAVRGNEARKKGRVICPCPGRGNVLAKCSVEGFLEEMKRMH